MTAQVRAILRSFLAAERHVRFGYEIMNETGLTTGSVYPTLHKLTDEGWLVGKEERSPTKGRPPRKCYQLTELGLAEARRVLAE